MQTRYAFRVVSQREPPTDSTGIPDTGLMIYVVGVQKDADVYKFVVARVMNYVCARAASNDWRIRHAGSAMAATFDFEFSMEALLADISVADGHAVPHRIHLSQSQHAAERARNQEKLQWTLQRKRDDIIQRASGHNLNLKLREPEELAKEVEEALHSQLSGNSYSEQFRVVWCCLNDTQNNVCGFKLLMGTMRPESLPSLTIMELQAPIPNDV